MATDCCVHHDVQKAIITPVIGTPKNVKDTPVLRSVSLCEVHGWSVV